MTKQELFDVSRFFNLAHKEMLKVKLNSGRTKSRIGAALVYKRRLINSGHNQPNKTSPLMKKYHEFKTTHAEVDCISGKHISPEKLSKCTLYLYRETMDGKLALSKPCDCCQKILKDKGIKKVFYTTENGFEEMTI